MKHSSFDWNPLISVKALGKFKAPVRAKKGSIGYDLYVPEDTKIPAKSRTLVPLNFAIELPHNVEGKIEPRSGFSAKGIEGFGTRTKWVLKWGLVAMGDFREWAAAF